MKTTLDLVSVVYDQLKSSSLKSAISGNVYKFKRPVNSDSEDVVINSLPITNEQLQTAVVNVNVFVPNVPVMSGGSESGFPDLVRLQALAAIAISELKDRISGDYTWDVQQMTVIEDEESGQYFANIRLQFFVSNI